MIVFILFLACTIPTVPVGMASCLDTDSDGLAVPSTMDVCTATCNSGQTPLVASATCQADGSFDMTLECPAGTYEKFTS